MKKPVLCLAALVCAALIIAGCTSFDGSSLLGGGGSNLPLFAPKFLYSGINGTNEINAFSVNASTGALTAVPGSPFSTAVTSPLFLGTNGTNLLFGNGFVNATVESFTVGGNGALASTGPNTFSGSTFAQGATTPAGTFYVVPDVFGNKIHVFSIGSGGALTEVAGSPFTGTGVNESDSVAISPDGKFVYCSNEGVAQINAFSINSTTGALTEIGGSPFKTSGGGFSIAVTSDGKFVYSTDENNGEINGFSRDATTGALTAIPGSPFGAATSFLIVTVDPRSKFVYATDGGTAVYGFSIGTNGALTAIPGSPFALPGGNSDYFVIADPSGKFVYVSDRGTHQVYGFSIGSNGALTAVTGSPFATTSGPGGMAITH